MYEKTKGIDFMPFKDKEKLKEYMRLYSKSDSSKAYQKAWHKKYQLKNKEDIKKRKAIWYLKNKSKRVQIRQAYYQRTKVYQTKKHIEWEKNEFKVNPLYRLNKAMGTNLRRRLFKNSVKWEKILGYTTNDLVNHLEKQFSPGMCILNYGDWQIDHKIPISFAKSREELIELYKLDNLQPIWKKENSRKNNRVVADLFGSGGWFK
jgi:5-methylcytosine-specific restriction endonuclease McrA